MKIDDLVSPCLCGCLRMVHEGSDGKCTSCSCPEFRRDGHVYPVSIGTVTT
jgi:hypothetical protein